MYIYNRFLTCGNESLLLLPQAPVGDSATLPNLPFEVEGDPPGMPAAHLVLRSLHMGPGDVLRQATRAWRRAAEEAQAHAEGSSHGVGVL